MIFKPKKYNMMDILGVLFTSTPIYSTVIITAKIIDGLIPSLQIVATAAFIDKAIFILTTGGMWAGIIPYLGILISLITYEQISHQLLKFVNVRMKLNLKEKLRIGLLEKRASLKYNYIENKESWDLISRVCTDPESKFIDGFAGITNTISIVIRVGGMFLILITHIWWAALLIVALSIPLFILAGKSGKATYETDREVTATRRKYEYLGDVLTGRDEVEERTLFGYTENINNSWWLEYEHARKKILKTTTKWFLRTSTGGIISYIIPILVVIILLKPVVTGVISLGMFMSLVNAVFSLVNVMSWQLNYIANVMARTVEYLKDFTEFMGFKHEIGALDTPSEIIPDFESLEFRNVSFKYPHTDLLILDNLTFKIKKGRHYAIVGINGAGKTTITKLITGLYSEYRGKILINNRDINEFKQSELKALCGVIYQDFARYYISVKDNIALGRINEINHLKEGGKTEQINSAVAIMELDEVISTLPNGIETPLGKIDSDGVDLSGGQWQKVAMARGIINKAPLRILDEPTAALDPVSESRIYQQFEEISKGGTTIFISHRMGSTKLADEILVLDQGHLLEKGNHNELIKLNGLYASMYESQKGWYK